MKKRELIDNILPIYRIINDIKGIPSGLAAERLNEVKIQ